MTDTAILEEVHAALNERRLDKDRAKLAAGWKNLAARQAAFRQAWYGDVAEQETMRMPRITGELGDPNRTVRMPIAAGIARPVVQHPVIAQIGRAVDSFYLEHGSAPEAVICWAMDILLLGDCHIEIRTDIVNGDVELVTESELAGRDAACICDARQL